MGALTMLWSMIRGVTSGGILGRTTSGTGRAEILTPAQVRTLCSVLSTAEVAAAYQPLDADLTALAALAGTNTMYYRSAADTWSAVTIGANLTFSGGTLSASGGGGAAALDDLTDVAITSVGAGELLRYDGSGWVNATVAEAGLATSAQGTLADSALQPSDIASGTITARAGAVNLSGGSDGDVLTVQADGSLAVETPAGGGGGNAFTTITPSNDGSAGTSVVADSASDTLSIDVACGGKITGDATTDKLTLDMIGLSAVPYTYGGSNIYGTIMFGDTGSLALAADRLYKMMYFVGKRVTLSQAAITVSTASAGSSIRLGIRAMDINTGEPGALVADFGTVDSSTTGSKEITGLSVTIDPGAYYLECVSDGTPTVRAAASARVPSRYGMRFSGTTPNPISSLYRTFTFAALPADETGVTQTESTTANVPLIGVR